MDASPPRSARNNAANPEDLPLMPGGLKGTNGVIGFGIIQWGAASSGSVNGTTALPVDAFTVNITATPIIPEPGTFGLVALGVLGLLLKRRR